MTLPAYLTSIVKGNSEEMVWSNVPKVLNWVLGWSNMEQMFVNAQNGHKFKYFSELQSAVIGTGDLDISTLPLIIDEQQESVVPETRPEIQEDEAVVPELRPEPLPEVEAVVPELIAINPCEACFQYMTSLIEQLTEGTVIQPSLPEPLPIEPEESTPEEEAVEEEEVVQEEEVVEEEEAVQEEEAVEEEVAAEPTPEEETVEITPEEETVQEGAESGIVAPEIEIVETPDAEASESEHASGETSGESVETSEAEDD
ncbi:hypothetical protein NQ315_016611 [Exocentrus adspersus]|uniref:Uncharacterized protein n=1 Tax=Exocentrus adspersus TaxID=1586481 RepID=A0AAV8VPQ6_9CUCU|nr:hypothetical protein NQ315_016611 [Exocentrus adspersus]